MIGTSADLYEAESTVLKGNAATPKPRAKRAAYLIPKPRAQQAMPENSPARGPDPVTPAGLSTISVDKSVDEAAFA
jgi:hypothetical protein